MKFCIKCGFAREGAFCSGCGFKFPDDMGQAPAQTGGIRIDFSQPESESQSESPPVRQAPSDRIIFPGLVYGEAFAESMNCANCGAVSQGGARCAECAG